MKRLGGLFLGSILVVALFLAACAEEEPTATPAPTATLTATTLPAATAAPAVATPTLESTHASPIAEESSKDPADYSDEELLEIAQALTDQFFAAVLTEPEPDLERAKSIYSLHCQPESDEIFAAQIEALLGLMGDDFSTEVITVERESDTAFLVFTLSVIGGTIIRSEPSLTIFENGRWVDNDCAAGRAAFGYLDEPEDESEPSIEIAFEEGDLPIVPEVLLPTLSNDPAMHTDEEIAASAEAIINAFWRGMFAVPNPDLEAMAETIAIECRDYVMGMITSDLDNLRWAYAYQGETAWNEVTGVQRVDDTSALVEALFSLDDVPLIEMVPSLHVFEDGQWRQGEC